MLTWETCSGDDEEREVDVGFLLSESEVSMVGAPARTEPGADLMASVSLTASGKSRAESDRTPPSTAMLLEMLAGWPYAETYPESIRLPPDDMIGRPLADPKAAESMMLPPDIVTGWPLSDPGAESKMLPPENMTGCPWTPAGRVAESTIDPSDSCTGWPLNPDGMLKPECTMLPPEKVTGCASTSVGKVAESTMRPSESCTGSPWKLQKLLGMLDPERRMLPPENVIGWP